jgi:hypothetical protein
VLAAGDDDYACIDYGGSLVHVVVGERFPEWQDPAGMKACANTKIPIRLGWMHWRDGRPRVLPVRPPGPFRTLIRADCAKRWT